MSVVTKRAFEDDARFRLLVDSIADYAVFLLTPEGIVASWNAGTERMTEYSANEVIGQHFGVFYTQEDQASGLPQTTLDAALAQGGYSAEGMRVRKDGSRFATHVTLHPMYEGGRHVGFAKITRDLTHQFQAQEALRASEQQFRLLVEGVVDYAIYLLDPTGRVLNWNAGAQRIKGYTAEEILGVHFGQFYPLEEQSKGTPDRNLQTALTAGRFEEEGWRLRKDGSRFYATVVIDPIFDAQGRHIGFGKVTRDITERRESEAKLDAAKAQLFQAQKMEAVGQLSGGIAHDFNNLLMVISSSLDLLRKRLDPSDQGAARLLENAAQATDRGATLTSRMLAFARRQDLDRKVVDPGVMLRGMADLLNHSVGSNISVEIKLPLRLPCVVVDPHQLETSILNLAVNSRDAMPGGGTMLISAATMQLAAGNPYDLPPGAYVTLSVEDDGTGMDDETLGRAIDPFFTTKGVGKGSGLGLSMVHGFAQQLDGALRLESKEGVGTKATIVLPAMETVAAREDEQIIPAVAKAANALKVLAVDDDFLVLMNITSMLQDLGHEVREAASGPEALEILRQEGPFDLLITDQAMPKMTGAELIEQVRVRQPDMPIIMASGYAEIPGGAPAGILRLSKPFNQGHLSDAIAQAVRFG